VARDVARTVQMTLAGATCRQIGTALGLSANTANRYQRRALSEIREGVARDVATLRAVETARLSAVVMAHWPQIADPRSAGVILRASEQMAKLHGLCAPVQVDVMTSELGEVDALVGQIAAALAVLPGGAGGAGGAG
jgi:hypothetical protein